MGNYIALSIRGKVSFHLDLVVTEGGVAKDFTGWTGFLCQLKATDDEDGVAISTVVVVPDVITADPSNGLLDVDISATDTTLIQDGAVHRGVTDIHADDAAGKRHLIAQGDWTLVKGVTEP